MLTVGSFVVTHEANAVIARVRIDALPSEHGIELQRTALSAERGPRINALLDELSPLIQQEALAQWQASLSDATKLPETLAQVRGARAALALTADATREQEAAAKTAQEAADVAEAKRAAAERELARLEALIAATAIPVDAIPLPKPGP